MHCDSVTNVQKKLNSIGSREIRTRIINYTLMVAHLSLSLSLFLSLVNFNYTQRVYSVHAIYVLVRT